jgi:hypothetical protein
MAWHEDDPADMPLEDLATLMRLKEDHPSHLAAKAEFNLRLMKVQMEATDAQKEAAEAEKIAANATVEGAKIARVSAVISFVSVLIALLAALASMFSAYFAYLSTIKPLIGDGPG